MARQTHHVVSNPDGGWDVKRGGGEKASRHFETKQEAIDGGRGKQKPRHRTHNS